MSIRKKMTEHLIEETTSINLANKTTENGLSRLFIKYRRFMMLNQQENDVKRLWYEQEMVARGPRQWKDTIKSKHNETWGKETKCTDISKIVLWAIFLACFKEFMGTITSMHWRFFAHFSLLWFYVSCVQLSLANLYICCHPSWPTTVHLACHYLPPSFSFIQ